MNKLEHLIIIAGPSCVGKTTLIDRLLKNELPEIAEKLNMSLNDSWYYADDWCFDRSNALDLQSHLLIHYDFFRHFNLVDLDFTVDNALTPIKRAKRIDIITLYESKERLLNNCENRRKLLQNKLLTFKVFDTIKRLLFLKRKVLFYQEPTALQNVYYRWFEFLANVASSQYWKYESNILEAIDISDPSLIEEFT